MHFEAGISIVDIGLTGLIRIGMGIGGGFLAKEKIPIIEIISTIEKNFQVHSSKKIIDPTK